MLPTQNTMGLETYVTRLEQLHRDWEPNQNQKRLIKAIFQDGYKRIFIRGGRKSSKTASGLYVAHRISGSGPKKISSIFGPSLKSIRKIVWNNRRLQDFAPTEWKGNPEVFRQTFPWGSFIEVDGSEHEKDHRGEEQDLIILDELKDHVVDNYEALYPNLAPRDGILLVFGTPPQDTDNLYYQLEQEAINDPDWCFMHWTYRGNHHISSEWIAKEKKRYYDNGKGDLWEVEYEARYVFGGKNAIFAPFDLVKHERPVDVIESFLKSSETVEYFVMINPKAVNCYNALFIAFDSKHTQIYVLGELQIQSETNADAAESWPKVLKKSKEVFPDGAKIIYLLRHDCAWYIDDVCHVFPNTPALSTVNAHLNDRNVGIGKTKHAMRTEHYKQADTCHYLRQALLAYRSERNGEFPKREPAAIYNLRAFFDYIAFTEHKPKKTVRSRLSLHNEDRWAEELEEEPMLSDGDLLWN